MEALITAATSSMAPPTRTHSLLVSPYPPPPFPPPPPPPPLTPARRAFSDITNTIGVHKHKRRLSTSIGQKLQIVNQVEKKVAEGIPLSTAVISAAGIDVLTYSRYKAIAESRLATPKKERIAKTRKRMNGGGRHHILTTEQDNELYQWLISLRRGENRERVSVKHLRSEALARFHTIAGFKASTKWAAGWMKRMGLSLRLRTTGKEVTTEAMQQIAQEYRLSIQHIFTDNKTIKKYNMDEFAVYLDAPGNTTIDVIGAHTVEIGTTNHEKDRVTVVLCVSSDGDKMDVLVIHKSQSEKKRNKITMTDVKYDNGTKTMRMFISYNEKAYMNSELMIEWIRVIYATQHNTSINQSENSHLSVLFLDNCPSHTTPEVRQCLSENRINDQFLPPNCTPLVQPVDHSINAKIKRAYEEQWGNWYHCVSPLNRTASGKRMKADRDTVNSWIAAAVSTITAEQIKKCFAHTLNGEMVLQEAKDGHMKRMKEAEAKRQRMLEERRQAASDAREQVEIALTSVLDVARDAEERGTSRSRTAREDQEEIRDDEEENLEG